MTPREDPAPKSSIPNVLSIAGSDPSGGAGIQADLKTFAALGCHGMAAMTALTAQNTRGVSAVHTPPAEFVARQITMVLDDVAVAAIKIGMLGSPVVAEAVAGALAAYDGPIVIDPVLVATSGASLGDAAVVEAMRTLLLPRAIVVTPNLAEAARLADMASLENADRIEACGRTLRAEIATAWLIKGGHGTGDEAVDLLFEEGGITRFASPRQPTRNTHGTGCTLSSAIAAKLALGQTLREAIASAKRYLDGALEGADRLTVGLGPGPVDHFAAWRDR